MSESVSPPPPVRLSERAARRIRDIVARDGRPGLFLRLAVEGGGCSGFRYRFDLDDTPQPDDVIVERDGARVAVDGLSLLFLVGAELDFVEDLTGACFRVHNPNATASCGCGTSFAV
ncbi:Iron-sulfur cluster insertion protein ErpA [bacterium HR40]|nr:Iron-sulfur cluster insertion protein ErpA [bacterium HR40]